MSVPTLNLLGGYKIPIIGLGTSGQREVGELEKALDVALENGYRHIDTAHSYGNEEIIGKVLAKWISSGRIKREEIFIVTKFPAAANTAERVEEHIKDSLKRLQLDYVDLYLIHFPVFMVPIVPGDHFAGYVAQPTDHVAVWKKMEEQVDAGRTRTIGLSNFNVSQVSRILNIARIKPAALQEEIHVYLQNEELVKFAQENGMVVIAYSPLGSPGWVTYSKESGLPSSILQDKTIVTIAAKYNKTPGQVMLRFLTQRNVVVIPKSYNPNRIKENINIFDFVLDENDFQKLRNLDIGEEARLCFGKPNPPSLTEHPEWPFKSTGKFLINPTN